MNNPNFPLNRNPGFPSTFEDYHYRTAPHMALSTNYRRYPNASSNGSNYPNHLHAHSRVNDLLPLPEKSVTMNPNSKKANWHGCLNGSSTKSVKDELFDHEMSESSSPQINGIDYTMIDSDINTSHHRTYPSHELTSLHKSQLKSNHFQKKIGSVQPAGNPLTEFDRRAMSSPNQTSSTIKQQPRSPPPYHPLTNGYFTHPPLQSTPSPDNERVSPLSNNLTESSSISHLIPSSVTAPLSSEEKRRCAVCNDVASGYHYGVWSCEGCKAFFKRSIQGTNEYICPATNTCTIDKHRRKSCQACRLRRCYEVGMTKGTTRRERKYRKKAVSVCKISSTSSNANATNNLTATNQEHGLLVPNTLTPPITSGTPTTPQIPNNSFSSGPLQLNRTTSDPQRYSSTPAEFIAALSQASRLNLPAKADTSRALDDQYFLQLLAKIFDQELVVLINWAKAMPGYTESLTLDQQVTIIEQSWLDTLLLDVIERSVEHNDDALHFAPDFIIPRNRDLSSPGLGSICTILFNILQAFKDPRTTHDEFIALKATILINSVPAIATATTKSFRLLTNHVYQSVQYTCDSNPSVYHDNYIRHFTLLLQIPHIKMLSLKLIRLFLNMRASDLLPQADLLLEMLEAQDVSDINSTFLFSNTDTTRLPSPTATFSQIPPANNINMSTTSSPILNASQTPPNYPIVNELNHSQMNYQASSSSLMNYSTTVPIKRSPSTPPVQYSKHPRLESIPDLSSSTNLHFPMNNSSY